MAQTERSPKTNNYPDNSVVSGLYANFVSGRTVYAADINLLIGMINAWIGHTHTYDDGYQLATFGNNGDRADYYEDKTTQNSGLPTMNGVSAGDTVTAAKHNEMKDRCNFLRVHDHTINDRTS